MATETASSSKPQVKERYAIDEDGHRVGVLLDIKEYRKLLEELKELESIRAYDAAKASSGEIIPFEHKQFAESREKALMGIKGWNST